MIAAMMFAVAVATSEPVTLDMATAATLAVVSVHGPSVNVCTDPVKLATIPGPRARAIAAAAAARPSELYVAVRDAGTEGGTEAMRTRATELAAVQAVALRAAADAAIPVEGYSTEAALPPGCQHVPCCGEGFPGCDCTQVDCTCSCPDDQTRCSCKHSDADPEAPCVGSPGGCSVYTPITRNPRQRTVTLDW